jgi:hypothetical protein
MSSPGGGANGEQFDRIVVTRADGSDQRIVANARLHGEGSEMSSERWMPDGKHISYVDNGSLWSVPAE